MNRPRRKGPDTHSHVVILPGQFERLAALSRVTGGAIGIFQDGSALQLDTGDPTKRFWINADGNDIPPPHQE